MRIFFPFAIVFVLSAQIAWAKTWVIKQDGSGDAPTIQAAIDAAVSADTILVASGVYDENLDTNQKWLVILSEGGAETTIIDGGRNGSVVRLTGGGVIEGFTLRNGSAEHGGGIFVASLGLFLITGNITGNTIVDNSSPAFDLGTGGGIYLDDTAWEFVVEDNVIRGNHAGDAGGGIFDGGGLNVFRDNLILENSSGVEGAGIRTRAALLIEGNLIAGNVAGFFGGGISGGYQIRYNTIVDNYTDNSLPHGAGIHITTGAGILLNNVLSGNGKTGADVGSGIYCLGFSGFVQIECNDSWANAGPDYSLGGDCDTTGLGNLSLDPMFCDATSGDYHISANSPCAPANSTCGLVGKYGVACGEVTIEPKSWGALKALYGRHD